MTFIVRKPDVLDIDRGGVDPTRKGLGLVFLPHGQSPGRRVVVHPEATKFSSTQWRLHLLVHFVPTIEVDTSTKEYFSVGMAADTNLVHVASIGSLRTEAQKGVIRDLDAELDSCHIDDGRQVLVGLVPRDDCLTF